MKLSMRTLFLYVFYIGRILMIFTEIFNVIRSLPWFNICVISCIAFALIEEIYVVRHVKSAIVPVTFGFIVVMVVGITVLITELVI